MDVTFVLEESGVTATVEVPCEADAAAAKEVACTALAVSPASVEMRIGTQVLEGTCRLQDTAFDSGVQVVLARRFANIKCPAEYRVQRVQNLSLSRCGTLCVYGCYGTFDNDYVAHVDGFDTETFNTAFACTLDSGCFMYGPPTLSQCKTCCYVPCGDDLRKVALPGGQVLRKLDVRSYLVFACGGVVVSKGKNGLSVYDEDLTLLRTLSHKDCKDMAVSDCGGWVITSSYSEKNARLWDVNTGEAVACVPAGGKYQVALSRHAAVFAVGGADSIHLYDWGGTEVHRSIGGGEVGCTKLQFTPCGKYVVSATLAGNIEHTLHQYDVATMSCVRVIPNGSSLFAISPCSRVVVFRSFDGNTIETRLLYPRE